ncbi:thiol reductant ABC exporter subunit CydD [Bacillus benzoevorans]|uniref:ATP-binding cassette subfamily C protein CydD n=1 Tax=Bacillus benzoevorans TaxID=1456 RepID=A0A7X0HMS4_9BACI|nr:thiol reductant ABC exporter subunit CydD [Bacillus benzoevorans]MBB6443446.1 ATP-binding cassette subfamily C protein CydD [Bacillus benzoevorans]
MDKHLFHYKGIKQHMFIVGILTVLQGITIVFQAVLLAAAITNMFNGTAFQAVLPYFAGFAAAFLTRHFLQWLKEKTAFHFAEKISFTYQSFLIKQMFKLGPRGIGKNGSGNMITLALEGIPKFCTYLELFIPRAIAMAAIPIVLLIYIYSADSPSGIVLTLTMPIMIMFLILLGVAAQKYAKTQWSSYQLLARHFVDSLRGLLTLKYLGKSKSHQGSIDNISNKYRIATIRSLRIAFLSSFSLDFFSSLSIAVVAVELGLRLIDGTIGLQAALTVLILAPEYFQPIRDLGTDYHATMDGKDAGNQIHRLLQKDAAEEQQPAPQIERWTYDSSLTVKELSKRSEEEKKPILENINFSIKGFQKVGIVGASGAGKSTLIDLLSGFARPSTGEISMDGVKINNFSHAGWQEQIIYIPQHPYIFSGTIADNIKLYAPDASREEIEEAIKVTGLTEFVDKLPNGLDEQIGQGGRMLSGGEEQRIALTRSLLQERPIMLFDEPTAHLDIETEHEIKQMLLPLMQQRLVFFATHRLHWMREMDIIFVLDNGKLVEIGHHHELLMKKDYYYRLVAAQGGILGGMD